MSPPIQCHNVPSPAVCEACLPHKGRSACFWLLPFCQFFLFLKLLKPSGAKFILPTNKDYCNLNPPVMAITSSALILGVGALWALSIFLILWAANSVSSSAVQQVIATIIKAFVWVLLTLGFMGGAGCVALLMEYVTISQVLQVKECISIQISLFPSRCSLVIFMVSAAYKLLQSWPLCGGVAFFVCGRLWGCLRRPAKESINKIVGVIPGTVDGLGSLAHVEKQLAQLISQPKETAAAELSDLRNEVLHLMGQLRDEVVNCVSKKDLSEALRDVHQRIPSLVDFEETPIVVALKKATGDLQCGVERLSSKVGRLYGDISDVNLLLTDAIQQNEMLMGLPIPTTAATATAEPVVTTNDDSSSSESSGAESDGFVQVIRVQGKDKSKKKGSKPIQATKLPSSIKQSMEGVETIDDLQAKLKAAKEELKREREANNLLTAEEKVLTREQLEQKWAGDRRTSRYGAREDRPLTEEEKKMNRFDLRRHLADEAQREWVKDQERRGVKLIPCETCGRLLKENNPQHICFRAPWTAPLQTRHGVPQRQEVIINASPSGVRIGRQTAIDKPLLEKNLSVMNETKARLDKLDSRMAIDAIGDVTSGAASTTYQAASHESGNFIVGGGAQRAP